jgi:hypothetical protein
MPTLTLDVTEYEALVELARRGANYEGIINLAKLDARCVDLVTDVEAGAALDSNKAKEIESFLKSIEARNDITRYFLAVRWQEVGVPLRVGIRFPETWPPELTAFIQQFSRAISRADVDALLAARATDPQTVMVTTDPGLRVGWTLLDSYFL